MSTRIPNYPRLVRGEPQRAADLAVAAGSELGERTFGAPIVDHRSSWVRSKTILSNLYFVKTYDYPSASDRWRGWLRNTGPLTHSRAAREYDAMAWLRAHELPTADPIAVLETRRFGLLRRAVLVSAAFPGTAADTLLATLAPAEQVDLARAIGRLVGSLHRRGFRDGNLDLRNLIVQRHTDSWCVAKIDSPRYRLCRPGPGEDRWTRRDWARLSPQLQQYGLAAEARAAASKALVPDTRQTSGGT